MLPDKTHYSLTEAAEFARCKPSDLLHYAVQTKITLYVGVPEWVNLRVCDLWEMCDIDPFLNIQPQLLALDQSHCLKIEINGKTEQSDFPEGYLVESTGNLKRLLPSYGTPELANKRWIYWRTFKEGLVCLLELIPERLFVLHSDLIKLIEPAATPEHSGKKESKNRKTAKSDLMDADTQQLPPNTIHGDPEVHVRETNDTVENKQSCVEQEGNSPRSERNPTILRLKQVMERTGLARSTIYDKMNPKSPRHDPIFPKQVNLGLGSVGWLESAISTWINGRK